MHAVALAFVAYGPSAVAALRAQVAAAKGEDLLAPVTVVVPSVAAGATLRRASAPLVNVSFLTLSELAERFAGRPRMPPAVARAHLRALAGGLVDDPEVASCPGTLAALERTFAELAGVADEGLDLLERRGGTTATTVGLYRRWRSRLAPAMTAADVVPEAAAALERGDADGEAVRGLGTVVVHLPRRLDPPAVRLLRALAARTRVHVHVGCTGHPDADEAAAALAAALGHAPPAGTGPAGGPPLPTRLVLVPDPAEEAAMAARQVAAALRDGTRPERIAVVSRVRDPYAAAVHAELAAAGIPHHAQRATTLAQSPAGRVLLGALALVPGDFRRADVVAFFRSAPLRDVPAPQWDRLAREAGVLGGLDQWIERPRAAAAARARWLATPEDELADRRITEWRRLADHMADLAARLVPPEPASWASWAAWAAALLEDLLDPAVGDRDAVHAVLTGLGALDGVEAPPTPERFRRVVELELDRPDGRHGRFGHGVLVGRLHDVAGADLDLVVVLGAADGLLPPGRHDDTLIPDRDRAGVGLPGRARSRAEEHRDLLAALAAAPVRVLVGPKADPRAQRERQPAPWLLDAASARAGRLVGGRDLPDLAEEEWFLDVASFEAWAAGLGDPATPLDLDVADLLADHAGGPDALRAGVVAAEDLQLSRGLAAALARRAGRFDEWSGRVGARPDLQIDLDRPRSPTGLELYAACPFRFYLSNVLRLGQVDDPTEAELISALDEGSLVHEVLERFVGESLGKRPDEPWSDEERARLLELLDETADRYRDAGRTGKPLLWGVRHAQLRHQLLRVLDVDERLRAERGVSPAAVELGFGLGDEPPVTLDLGGGRTVAFKGSADRIDVSPDGSKVVVYDYKSGKHEPFLAVEYKGDGDGDLTASGTKLQLPIYALAARARWPAASEVEARYWFVGARSNGRTLGGVFDAAAEERFRTVVGTVLDGVEQGRFPANPGRENYRFGAWSHDNCGWCDFDRVCSTTRGEAWVEIRRAPELRSYLALAEGPTDPDAPAGGGDRAPRGPAADGSATNGAGGGGPA